MEIKRLAEWFQSEKRDLPWRREPTPYAVWVSEVMLQQTQVAVVIPYFHRWMKKFPTIEDLASAPLEEVIKAWEGLGYYSRARNLHRGAQEVVARFKGALPSGEKELLSIQGVGPYTVGAIRSFAFGKKAPAIDGNVMRVVTRFFFLKESINKQATRKEVEKIVFRLLPDTSPSVIMEGLIELGALICQKAPDCPRCPLKTGCLGYLSGEAATLPVRRERSKTVFLKRFVLVLLCGEEVLIRKAEEGRVMGGLYEFPFQEDPVDLCKAGGERLFDLPSVTHTFTHHRATLFPSVWRTSKKINRKGCEWRRIDSLSKLPFSSGHRKIKERWHAHFAHGEF